MCNSTFQIVLIMKKRLYYQYAASCCLLLFLFLGYMVKFYPQQLTGFDQFFSNMIRGSLTPTKTAFFKAITQLGSGKVIAGLCILLALFFTWHKKYVEAIWIVINTAVVAGVGNYSIKFFFARQRPSVEHLVHETSYSFPSGHSMGSALFYGTCFILAYYFIQNKALRVSIQVFLLLLILAIGISRIYLGVHYPTDVLGGYLLGSAWVLFTYPIYLKQRLLDVYKQQKRTSRSRRRR